MRHHPKRRRTRRRRIAETSQEPEKCEATENKDGENVHHDYERNSFVPQLRYTTPPNNGTRSSTTELPANNETGPFSASTHACRDLFLPPRTRV